MSLDPLVALAHVDEGRRVVALDELLRSRDVDLLDLGLDLLQQLAVRGHCFQEYSEVIAAFDAGRRATLASVSPRVRVYIITGVAALAAAGIAVGVAWTGRRGGGAAAATAQGGPREGAPPLALDVLVDDANEAVALEAPSPCTKVAGARPH